MTVFGLLIIFIRLLKLITEILSKLWYSLPSLTVRWRLFTSSLMRMGDESQWTETANSRTLQTAQTLGCLAHFSFICNTTRFVWRSSCRLHIAQPKEFLVDKFRSRVISRGTHCVARSLARFKSIGFPLLGISSKTSVCHEAFYSWRIHRCCQAIRSCMSRRCTEECCAECSEAGKALSTATWRTFPALSIECHWKCL